MSGIFTSVGSLLVGSGGGGSIPSVTVSSSGGTGGNTAATSGVTTTTGRNLYVFGNSDPATTSITVTDTYSNTWTAMRAGGKQIWGWKCENATGGASHVITLTPNTTGLAPSAVMFEVSGAAVSGSTELYAESTDGASPFDTTITTSQTNRLLINVLNTTNSSPSSNINLSSTNWTLIQAIVDWSSVYPCAVFQRNGATATTYTGSYTDAGSTASGMDIAVFAIHS
jgi:hypothetical protein